MKKYLIEIDEPITCDDCKLLRLIRTSEDDGYYACSLNPSPVLDDDGDEIPRPNWCPLIDIVEMKHPAEDRPDCAGMKWPKCYVEREK